MKEGWLRSKMSDVFYLQMGKTPSRDNKAFWNGETAWVSISDMSNVKYISDTKEKITNEAIVETGIKEIPIHTVIMSFKLSVGKVAITTQRLYTNEAIMAFIPKDEYDLLPEFVYYSLMGHHWEGYNRAVMGVTLNKTTISKSDYSFPPLAEQKRIVEELDLLSGIIEKQKQQLKELDTLAQSIFYDMFGDPVSNEKGWEMKKISEVSINLDSQRKPVTKAEREKGPYPYYGASGIVDYVSNFIFDGIYLLVSEDGANLLTRNQPIAFLSFGKVWINNHAHVLDFKDYSSKIYLMFYLNQLDLKDRVKGAAQPKLTQKDLNEINILWPPLALQNLFASKIEAIEKQKEAITKSIAESQKLFDYTMDKYFG